MPFDAGADFVTHITRERPLDAAEAARMAAKGQVRTPALTMTEGTAASRGVAPAATPCGAWPRRATLVCRSWSAPTPTRSPGPLPGPGTLLAWHR